MILTLSPPTPVEPAPGQPGFAGRMQVQAQAHEGRQQGRQKGGRYTGNLSQGTQFVGSTGKFARGSQVTFPTQFQYQNGTTTTYFPQGVSPQITPLCSQQGTHLKKGTVYTQSTIGTRQFKQMQKNGKWMTQSQLPHQMPSNIHLPTLTHPPLPTHPHPQSYPSQQPPPPPIPTLHPSHPPHSRHTPHLTHPPRPPHVTHVSTAPPIPFEKLYPMHGKKAPLPAQPFPHQLPPLPLQTFSHQQFPPPPHGQTYPIPQTQSPYSPPVHIPPAPTIPPISSTSAASNISSASTGKKTDMQIITDDLCPR